MTHWHYYDYIYIYLYGLFIRLLRLKPYLVFASQTILISIDLNFQHWGHCVCRQKSVKKFLILPYIFISSSLLLKACRDGASTTSGGNKFQLSTGHTMIAVHSNVVMTAHSSLSLKCMPYLSLFHNLQLPYIYIYIYIVLNLNKLKVLLVCGEWGLLKSSSVSLQVQVYNRQSLVKIPPWDFTASRYIWQRKIRGISCY